jgi:ubiquitin C-terminal hydrolase
LPEPRARKLRKKQIAASSAQKKLQEKFVTKIVPRKVTIDLEKPIETQKGICNTENNCWLNAGLHVLAKTINNTGISLLFAS